MPDSVVENLTDRQLHEIADWLIPSYDDIAKACEEKGLPKPPPV